MNEDVAREMTKALHEITGLAKESAEMAAAACHLSTCLAGVVFTLQPNAQEAVVRTLEKKLNNPLSGIEEKSIRRALEFIRAAPDQGPAL